ncbi:polysaccharide deacetylase family protein [Paenibacillus koleovorans]|uniref:polysaccharide deacetylase family protein n=1 Tax=Paenibacillus koleovorans TaxID=121608 RepID=UPI000FDB78E3|nr:polysaccharide deacetylase family protein [Paenibacillus koleovorans]
MSYLRKLMIIAGAAVLLAGCSGYTDSADQTPASTIIHASPLPALVQLSSSTPAASPTPTPTPTPLASASPSPTPRAEYRLNANYDVVPLDPNGNKKVVLLTFDDGPKDRELNEKLLATLDKHKAKAIFFVNGYRVKQNPDLLKLLHERGQVIGNHSWDHIDLKLEKPEVVDKQIRDVQEQVQALIGEKPVFFRPPYGSGSDYVRQRAKEEGLLYMTWSNGSEDWVAKYQTPPAVIQRVLEQLHFGSNILMHELPWTAEALDELLTRLEERGYSFVDPRTIQGVH